MAIRRTLYLIPTLVAALLLAWPAFLHAENAIRYTDATAQPGDIVTIDMIMENDVVISGAAIPFRWSSPDVSLIEVVILEDRFKGVINESQILPDAQERTSGVFFVRGTGIFDQGWVNPGSGVLAHLRFQVAPGAPDQVVYIDSVYKDDGGGVTEQSQFSDFQGTQVIFPNVYLGTITVGQPDQAVMDTWPLSLSFSIPQNEANPSAQALYVSSSNGIDFLWSLEWTAPWLLVSPIVGKSPAEVSVGIDRFGMAEGEYEDEIIIDAPSASNSPLAIPVHLTVEEARPDTSGGVATASLMQNHPNPFSLYREQRTTIGFNLLKADHVEITIYDAMGRRVKTIYSAQRSAGEGSVDWDGRDANGDFVASGHYFYRLKTSNEAVSRRMIVIK
jgi:hypothetical protein